MRQAAAAAQESSEPISSRTGPRGHPSALSEIPGFHGAHGGHRQGPGHGRAGRWWGLRSSASDLSCGPVRRRGRRGAIGREVSTTSSISSPHGLAANNLTLARVQRDIGAAGTRSRSPTASTPTWRSSSATSTRCSSTCGDSRTRSRSRHRDGAVRGGRVAEPLLATPEIAPIWSLAKKVLHHDRFGTRRQRPNGRDPGRLSAADRPEQRLAQMQERGRSSGPRLARRTGCHLHRPARRPAEALLRRLGAIRPENLPNLLTNLRTLAGDAFALVRRVGDFASSVIGRSSTSSRTRCSDG
jgi:hypothetical protein